MSPLDLDGPPPCIECGAPLHETHHPAETWDDEGETRHEREGWSYTCTCAHSRGWNDRPERLTCRNAPWTRALADEVVRLRAERDEAHARGVAQERARCLAIAREREACHREHLAGTPEDVAWAMPGVREHLTAAEEAAGLAMDIESGTASAQEGT